MSLDRFGRICYLSSLTLIVSLPWLVPFGPGRNIDQQGLILLIAGALAWLTILLRHDYKQFKLPSSVNILLCLFVLSLLLSTVINPHYYYDIYGAPYIRLGAAGFLACIGSGLLLCRLNTEKFINYLYIDLALLALVSVPYTWFKFHSFTRVSGIVNQADVFACFLGCGILLGLYLLANRPKHRSFLILSELLMAILLVLTQTRAVLGLVIILSLVWILLSQRKALNRRAVIYLLAGLVIVSGVYQLLPGRVTNIAYASQSISYRLNLQKYAIKASTERPFLGYGPGNLADALDCKKLDNRALKQTCSEGYFFNSSHNIFIDRLLAVGWVGGAAFLGFVILAIYRGLQQPKTLILSFVALLIALYYLTNVTSVSLELLLWILLFRLAHVSHASA